MKAHTTDLCQNKENGKNNGMRINAVSLFMNSQVYRNQKGYFMGW